MFAGNRELTEELCGFRASLDGLSSLFRQNLVQQREIVESGKIGHLRARGNPSSNAAAPKSAASCAAGRR